MAKDATMAARAALMTLLKESAAVTDLVPAASIYPQQPPAMPPFPFIRYGTPSTVPLRASCLDGSEVSVAIHVFSKGADGLPGEDHAGATGAAIAAALDRVRVPVDGLGVLKVRWRGSQLLQDGADAGAFHSLQQFAVRVLS